MPVSRANHILILGIIKRSFIYMDESSFILLYKSTVRPHLDYINYVVYIQLRCSAQITEGKMGGFTPL